MILKDLRSQCSSVWYSINYISLTMLYICIKVINLSTELPLIMLTLLKKKKYGDRRKTPFKHMVSWWGDDRGHRNEAVWQVHGMLGKLIAGLCFYLVLTLFNWCWMRSKGPMLGDVVYRRKKKPSLSFSHTHMQTIVCCRIYSKLPSPTLQELTTGS